MCKKFIMILSAAVLTVVLVQPKGNAEGISVGAASFYSWWSPSFTNLVSGKITQVTGSPTIQREFSLPPSFLVGPTVSVTLPAGFSISSVFLYGSWFKGYGSSILFDGSSAIRTDFNVKKWDLDVLLNYSLNQYVKLFGGIKYQGYRYSYVMTVFPAFQPLPLHASQGGWGPGLGVSLTLNLWGPVYFLANASMMYLYTTQRLDASYFRDYYGIYNTVGFNGAASVAWLIEPASVTISLGFRYQYLHYIRWDSRTPSFAYVAGSLNPNAKLVNDDHFYGITLAAIYSLNLN